MTTEQQQTKIDAILERIIDREILANASQLVSELAQDESGRWIDDLAPCLDGPDLDELPEGYRVDRHPHGAWVWQLTDNAEGYEGWHDCDTEREAVQAAWDDAGDEPPRREALQHWIVSDWLADKLEANGALVARDVLGFDIWGRTDCGQALSLNGDLQTIARQLADL